MIEPQGLMLPKGLGKLKTFIHLIRSRTRDLPACSVLPQPLRYRVEKETQFIYINIVALWKFSEIIIWSWYFCTFRVSLLLTLPTSTASVTVVSGIMLIRVQICMWKALGQCVKLSCANLPNTRPPICACMWIHSRIHYLLYYGSWVFEYLYRTFIALCDTSNNIQI
jgi:hypothetical protein